MFSIKIDLLFASTMAEFAPVVNGKSQALRRKLRRIEGTPVFTPLNPKAFGRKVC